MIGRNEGMRLQRCFDTFPADVAGVVYVDSASTDGSVELARGRGFEVVDLDMSVPFSAARARNAGLRKLRSRWPDLRYVQLIDGDCSLAPAWLDAALGEMSADATLAMVCGRRRELDRFASIYNRLCDMEWNTPVGDANSCGGDALARIGAILEVDGFDDEVTAGEEPELCARLRARGWKIRRIEGDMTFHDAAMSRFSQWWRRCVRSGHGFAQVNEIHPSLFRRELRSSVAWGLLLPAAALLAAVPTGGLGLALLLCYPVLFARILYRRLKEGDPRSDAALYASFCVLAKFPEACGVARYAWNRSRNRRMELIEYK